MKDQNTPTNTLEELREQILIEFKQVHKLAPADYTENCTNVVMSLVSQTVNKANEEAEYWRKRAARWKKEVEELDGKLMDIELNRDETPKGDK